MTFEDALSELCRRARTQGVSASELASALLQAGARYARTAGWSLTRTRKECCPGGSDKPRGVAETNKEVPTDERIAGERGEDN